MMNFSVSPCFAKTNIFVAFWVYKQFIHDVYVGQMVYLSMNDFV